MNEPSDVGGDDVRKMIGQLHQRGDRFAPVVVAKLEHRVTKQIDAPARVGLADGQRGDEGADPIRERTLRGTRASRSTAGSQQRAQAATEERQHDAVDLRPVGVGDLLDGVERQGLSPAAGGDCRPTD